ncbi:MAG: radical SAM protein [Bacteroidales bacterium]|nr:radical SAM protein [Bacteroidales bacterium]
MYYSFWFIQNVFGIKKPLINTMVILYDCNLNCKHCNIADKLKNIPEPHTMSYATAKGKMIEMYKKGARVCYFEGGETTLWKDKDRDLSNLINLAKEIGYFTIGYTTNGTNVIFEQSDVISVSLDGPEDIHDKIRTKGVFNTLMNNLKKTNHKNIFANMTISKINIDYIEETVKIASENKAIAGIMLNFITPPPDDIALTKEEKIIAIKKIKELKKKSYPILNSSKALENLKNENWQKKCPFWMSAFVLPDGSEVGGCPMKSDVSCRNCGFDAPREYYFISKGFLPTIFELTKRFALSMK